MSDFKKLTSLIPDRPIEHESGDFLGYSAWAKHIADLVRGMDGPLVIGVLGPWGSGKTSVLQLTQQSLAETETTVWFNAWQYDYEEWPLIPLISTVLETVDPSGSSDKPFPLALRSLLAAFSAKVEVDLPMLGKVGGGFDGKEAISRYESLSEDWVDFQVKNTKAMQALRRLDDVAEEGARLVVFVDDLDRCAPARALRLLEQIKLVLNHPGIRFVVALAPRVLEAHLEYQYGNSPGVDARVYATDYLEKIIQIPLWLSRREEDFSLLGKRLVETTRFAYLFQSWPPEHW